MRQYATLRRSPLHSQVNQTLIRSHNKVSSLVCHYFEMMENKAMSMSANMTVDYTIPSMILVQSDSLFIVYSITFTLLTHSEITIWSNEAQSPTKSLNLPQNISALLCIERDSMSRLI